MGGGGRGGCLVSHLGSRGKRRERCVSCVHLLLTDTSADCLQQNEEESEGWKFWEAEEGVTGSPD